ncbi:hypothetical protein [Streptomyces sp. NBC_01262]|uniref:hypothetical protein n=1 Tax=Streptomyces sp. NBC_01262 TaxID=2903803 RepID=UPI002E355390|nr:hypothetical protein [Streptomyces sp. NBC_01262]
MTSPASLTCHIAGLEVTPQTPVLIRRRLYVAVPHHQMPRFGDRRWELRAAMPDRHTASQAILWDTYPVAFVNTCKLYLFALVNVVDDAPRLPYARGDVPSIKTIQSDQPGLRAFLSWLDRRGVRRLCDITATDLDAYYRHVSDQTATSDWKRRRFVVVQRLHAYREVLPEECRLPVGPLWGGATAAELAEFKGPWGSENRTPRIHPDVMEPLLSAALLTTETIAADLLPTAQNLIAMRVLAHDVAPEIRRQGTRHVLADEVNRQQLDCLLTAFAEQGHALPGMRVGGRKTVDVDGLSVGGWLNRSRLRKYPSLLRKIDSSRLPITTDLLRVTRFSTIGRAPWRDHEIDATELVELIRHVATACFLVIDYLSGIRTGEALNLRRGCISRDDKLGLTFMSGMQLKAGEDRRERSPDTIPWVVTEPTARAVAVLEALSPGQLLFPPGGFRHSQQWFSKEPTRTRTPGSISHDISDFITWFNTSIAPLVGHPVIGEDPNGKITAPRLRRTLAWHIVRRPGGIIAGATQYGHLRTQIMQGYAGHADAGFLDEITFEEFLLRAETIHDDHQRLLQGEHVSGPAAGTYRARVAAGSCFAGLTVTTTTQVNNALANPDLQIHHGALVTCVYRRETAACNDTRDASGTGPFWPRCRLSCRNIARTDQDIVELKRHARRLSQDLDSPGIPDPLRHRVKEHLEDHERAIAEHEATLSPAEPTPRRQQ